MTESSKNFMLPLIVAGVVVSFAFFFTRTAPGLLVFRAFFTYFRPNSSYESGLSLQFRKNKNAFLNIAKLMELENFDYITITKLESEEFKITHSGNSEKQLDSSLLINCKRLMDNSKIDSIRKLKSNIVFTTIHMGYHKGGTQSLIYYPERTSQIDPIWGRDFFTLDDHWAIFLN